MSRAIPLLAVLCTGVALGVLIFAILGASRTDPGLIEEVAPLDAAAAIPEIAQIRELRGSVLAGTALATQDDASQFAVALADQSGVSLSPSEPQALVEQLRHTAQDYEQQAQQMEKTEDYAKADELRQLADHARQLARSIHIAGSPKVDLPTSQVINR